MKKILSIILALLMTISAFAVSAMAASKPSFSIPKGWSYNAKTKTLQGKGSALKGPQWEKLDYSKNWISDPIQKKNAEIVNSASMGWALADPMKKGQITKVQGDKLIYDSLAIKRNKKGQVTAIEPGSDTGGMAYSGVEYTYDSKGRLHSVTEYPSHGNPDTYTFNYDDQGRLTSYTKEYKYNPDTDEPYCDKHVVDYSGSKIVETVQTADGQTYTNTYDK